MTWQFFDEQEFEQELSRLESRDRAKLVLLMELYLTIGPTRPVYVESYGEQLPCLRHTSGAYKGRCLFFVELNGGPVALLAYRKESAKADPRAVERARNRMNEYERNHD